jgi:hypothetical protein
MVAIFNILKEIIYSNYVLSGVSQVGINGIS